MSKTSFTSDGLVTTVDVQMFRNEVNHGCFKARLCEMAGQEPQLAKYISEHNSKVLRSLTEIGMDGRRLAALHRHISLMVWGSVILMSRAHRRQWDGFLPSEQAESDHE